MTKNFPTSYCVFDFETTGFDPVENDVLEFALLRIKDGKETGRISHLVKWPGKPVPEKITEITTITQDMVDGIGIDPSEAFSEFLKFTKGFPLVGHNIAKFDIPFLIEFMRKNGVGIDALEFIRSMICHSAVDTAAVVKGAKIKCKKMDLETHHEYALRVGDMRVAGVKFNLGLACEENGIPIENGQHRAMADVLLTNELYKKLCLS